MNGEIYYFGKHKAFRIGFAIYKEIDKTWHIRFDIGVVSIGVKW